jgi:hypothetical protein
MAMNTKSGQMFPIEKSNLYHLVLEEKEHISKNRWYMSEKLGYDVGWETANLNWHMCHRSNWISGLKTQGRYNI